VLRTGYRLEKKQWWLEKSQEFRINYQTKKIFFDVVVLGGGGVMAKWTYLAILQDTCLTIYKVYFGKQLSDKGFLFIEVA